VNKYYSNKLNAYRAVKGVLNRNRDIVESFEMVVQAVKEFYEKLDEIERVGARAISDTTGETAAKKKAKERLAYVASSLAACGAVFAVNKADKELEASLKYSYSDIKYGLDNEAMHTARAIEEILLDRRTELIPYLVSDQDLDDLHQKIQEYDNALKARGGAKSGSVAENKRLAILFRSTDDLLERKLDRFVFRLKARHLQFYDAYSNARLIDDL